jgi:hypothetical protein
LKGKLHLDSQQGWLTGGASGPALVPGDVDASTLIRAVRYDGEITMPPAGKLDAREIALLEEWVRRGAPAGAGDAPAPTATTTVPFEERSNGAATHWAFQRMSNAPPPEVADARWPRNESIASSRGSRSAGFIPRRGRPPHAAARLVTT